MKAEQEALLFKKWEVKHELRERFFLMEIFFESAKFNFF
jgi:hypothetical protein